MKLFLCFLAVLSFIHSSHIYSRDPILDYSNAGFLSNLGIPFMLTSSLASKEYLSLTTSFSLHSQLQNTVTNYSIANYYTPSNLYMNLSLYSSECVIPSPQTPTMIYTKSVDSTNYLIKFLDNSNNYMDLTQGVWYVLWVNMTDANVLNMQVSNKLLQIQLSTVSDSQDNYIIYDSNPVISVFQLLDTPPTTLQTNLYFDNPTSQNILSSINLVYIGKNYNKFLISIIIFNIRHKNECCC